MTSGRAVQRPSDLHGLPMVPSRRWAPAVEWNARVAIPRGLADAWSNEPSCERTEQWLALIWIIQPRGLLPGRDANGAVPHGQVGVVECHQRQASRGTVRLSTYNNSFGSTVCNWVGGVLGSNLCRVLLATSVVHSGAVPTAPLGAAANEPTIASTMTLRHACRSSQVVTRRGRPRCDQRPANQGPTAPEDTASYR